MKHTLLITAFLVLAHITPCQDIKTMSYKAYLSMDTNEWLQVVKAAKASQETNNYHTTFDLAFAQFGLMAATMYAQDEDLFDEYLDSTKDLLELLMDYLESWAEPRALASFIMGFQIANSPMKAIYLGPRSNSLMNEAMKLDDQSPIVVQLYAGSKYFTPFVFGGDVDETIKSYNRAIQLFEETGRTDEWLYLDALAHLGLSYMRKGDRDEAIKIYKKALEVEPEFHWVRDNLLPRALSVNP